MNKTEYAELRHGMTGWRRPEREEFSDVLRPRWEELNEESPLPKTEEQWEAYLDEQIDCFGDMIEDEVRERDLASFGRWQIGQGVE